MVRRVGIVMTALFSFVFIAGCSPKMRLDAPPGWKVARTEVQGDKLRLAVLADGSGNELQVSCLTGGVETLALLASKTLATVDQLGGRVTEYTANMDLQAFTIRFALVNKNGRRLIGANFSLVDQADGDTVVSVIGLWPAEQDDKVAPAFDRAIQGVHCR